jgi:glycosyltransferase involved in cell wall biosynthesis
LHVVKTSDGAVWAAKLATKLSTLGVEVHVVLPRLDGRAISYWQRSGATLHEGNLDVPVRHPSQLPEVLRNTRRLVAEISPDIIHSHFVGTTLMLRLALGKRHPVPRIFQVPGPLHLEHSFYRRLELSLAGPCDYWIGSSRCIVNHYLSNGVSRERIFLSYYGDDLTPSEENIVNSPLRSRVGARRGEVLVGTISWMYPPKFYLGQRTGLKAHEDLIDALGIVCRKDPRVRGVIAGSAWGGAEWYERRLKERARKAAYDRITFTGALPFSKAKHAWRDLDLAVHVPISENCGGVVEPLLARVPIIASRVGGLPEVIFDGLTGTIVPPRDPERLSETILQCIKERDHGRQMALRGEQLVRTMFDVDRTAREVLAVYRHVLSGDPRPAEFDSCAVVATLTANNSTDSKASVPKRESQAEKEFVPCPR